MCAVLLYPNIYCIFIQSIFFTHMGTTFYVLDPYIQSFAGTITSITSQINGTTNNNNTERSAGNSGTPASLVPSSQNLNTVCYTAQNSGPPALSLSLHHPMIIGNYHQQQNPEQPASVYSRPSSGNSDFRHQRKAVIILDEHYLCHWRSLFYLFFRLFGWSSSGSWN